MTTNDPNLDPVNINVYKFGEILSICSQDIEWKEILTSTKGHNSVTRKMTDSNPNLDLVWYILSLCSQAIERKQNF